jgi:hypothetical protein
MTPRRPTWAERLALVALCTLSITSSALGQPAAESSDTSDATVRDDAAPSDETASSAQTPAGASAVAAANANVEKARQHFQRGIESYRDGDLSTALIEFKRAYSTAPNYRLLYNLGQVSTELRDYPAAELYLTQYLQESQGAIDESRRRQVQDELDKVRARIAFVQITSDVDGMELLVDDVIVGRTPLTLPVHVSTGKRRVTGRAPGHNPTTQVIDAAGGEVVAVHLSLQPLVTNRNTSNTAEPQVPESPAARVTSNRLPLLIGLAIGTGVLAAGGGVFAYLAENDAGDYRAALGRKTSSTELKDYSGGARSKALVADLMFGTALLAATVGTIVWFSPDHPSSERASVRVGLGSLELTQHF